MSQHIVCGIDVGNSAVKTVIAGIEHDSSRPRILGVGSAPSNGLRRGVIVDMEEAIASVKQSLAMAQKMAGVAVDHAYVGVNGMHIKTQLSRGVVAVARADSEISQSDIDRVVEAASTVSLPQNYEIIHVIPRNFIIDGQDMVKNPLGMKGIRLEVEVLLIEGLSPYIHNLTKCINSNNVDIAELVYSPLASSKAVLDKHQREYGVMLLDLGGGITSLALFHEGDLLHTAVLPVGSRHITNDIAIAFKTSIDSAEKIKLDHGTLDLDTGNKKDQVDLTEYLGEELVMPRKSIARIIDARVGELFEVVSAEIKKTPGTKVLPAGLVMAGGGANLDGLINYSKNKLGISAKYGSNYTMEGLSDAVSDPSFATAIGLVMWGFEEEESPVASRFSGTGNILGKIGKWFKNFIP